MKGLVLLRSCFLLICTWYSIFRKPEWKGYRYKIITSFGEHSSMDLQKPKLRSVIIYFYQANNFNVLMLTKHFACQTILGLFIPCSYDHSDDKHSWRIYKESKNWMLTNGRWRLTPDRPGSNAQVISLVCPLKRLR